MRFAPYWREQPEDSGRVGITHPSIKPALKTRGLRYLYSFMLSIVILWLPLCIFLGASYKRLVKVNHIQIEIIDLDHGSIGSGITQIALDEPRSKSNVVWRIRNGISDLNEAKNWVRDHGWGALVINEGATQRLLNAMRNDDADYNPSDAMTLLESTGRHPVGAMMFSSPSLTRVAQKASLFYATRLIRDYKANPEISSMLADSNNGQLSENSARILVQPVGYRTVDVGPYSFPTAPVAYLFSFFPITLCFLGLAVIWKLTTFSLITRTKPLHLYLLFLILTCLWAFVFGIYAGLGFLAFKSPTYSSNHEGLPFTFGRFVCLSLTSWIVLLSMALWILNWCFVCTPQFIPLVSVCTVISNIISMVVPVNLAPDFFRWFYATPFFNGAMLFRYILSGAYPKLGLNLGVLLGEAALMSVLLFFTASFRQCTALTGITDIQGWYRGSLFFKSPIPYYKDVKAEEPQQRADSLEEAISAQASTLEVHVVDSIGANVSIKDGNLGV